MAKGTKKIFGLFCALGLVSASTCVQANDIQTYRQQHELEILNDFRTFLSFPNVATNIADMEKNALWITSYIAKRGFTSEIVIEGGAPYVIAERTSPGATKTILIYAHFDGQPVAPENWASPPFEPTLRTASVEAGGDILDWGTVQSVNPEWRIFGRSAGDDKAPVIALMAALDALAEAGTEPSVNIKLVLDGEEEAGSPTLDRILAKHGEKLAADLMLFCDGPMHQSRKRQLVFGVRGSMTVDLTAYGPSRPLHSGHYGGWAPNPSEKLMALLVGMKDSEGNITVPGYSAPVRPITEAERRAIAALPNMDASLKQELAVSKTDGSGKRLEEIVMGPSIIVKGFEGGGVGPKSRNIIMPSATASLNLRLAPGQTPETVRAALTSFFLDKGFSVFEREPTKAERVAGDALYVDWRPGAYRAFRSNLDSQEAVKLISILNSLDGNNTLLTPTMGGSLPIYLFEDTFPEMPIVLLPIANHDNNQHGRNENLRIQNLWDAIDIYGAVLTHYGL
ncbi:MAG: M20/M25/M40 family metallo-hydrolase [Alphaproteobacteria bacterium]|nr:M20/M25/M40 family metallo-hydrolase [Alphaproteobacteria bacterium]